MTRETQHLIAQAAHVARDGGEMARFNLMRAKLLSGEPPTPERRMPLPFSGVGADVAENAG